MVNTNNCVCLVYTTNKMQKAEFLENSIYKKKKPATGLFVCTKVFGLWMNDFKLQEHNYSKKF